jgi:hypothetical protein
MGGHNAVAAEDHAGGSLKVAFLGFESWLGIMLR